MTSPITPAKSLLFLMHDVSRLLRRQMDERARALGLTSAQWRVLASIARAEMLEQEPLSQAVLAEMMDMEPITLSRHVDRMEAAGLIERRPNPYDRRAYRLYLTDTARPLVDRFKAMSGDCLGNATQGITEAETALATEILTRMRANIVETQAKSDSSEDMTAGAAKVAGQVR
jgi:MarR family transcriptional regulator for hemolysin